MQITKTAFLGFIAIAVVLQGAVTVSSIEIPCSTDPNVVFTLHSNRDYTLTNCRPAAGTDPGVSIAPDATALVDGVLVLQNISLTVVGGGVLPLLTIPITAYKLTGASCNIQNVTIFVSGVRVGPYEYNYTVRSLESIFYVRSTNAVARNVTLVMEDTVVDIHMTNAFSVAALGGGIFVIDSLFVSVEGISIVVRGGSNFSSTLDCGSSLASSVGLFSVLARNMSSISTFDLRIVDSSLSFLVNSSSTLSPNSVYASAVRMMCGADGCNASNVNIIVSHSTVVAQHDRPAHFLQDGVTYPIYEVVSFVMLYALRDISTLQMSLQQSKIRSICTCSSMCDTASVGGHTAAAVWISGRGNVGVGTARNLTILATNVAATIVSSSKVAFLMVTDLCLQPHYTVVASVAILLYLAH